MAMLGDGSQSDAISFFEKKFKDKSGLRWEDRGNDPKSGKCQYGHRIPHAVLMITDAYVEKNYNADSDDENEDGGKANGAAGGAEDSERPKAQSKLTRSVQELMELIFDQKYFQNTMAELNYDVNKMPLGKLSKGTITRGFQALKELATIIDDPSQAMMVEDLSNRYYSLIPHDFGRNRPPIIYNNDILKKEIDLLDSLSEMKEATDMLKASLKNDSEINLLDSRFQTLGMHEMEALNSKSLEFAELSNYLTRTKGPTHNVKYAVQEIFRIQRKGEFERFEKSHAKHSGNRRLLWHGSRVTNFAGILSQGLRIAPPEAPVSGYMFGKGIYLADMSSKSANYCCSYQSGNTALLLLCEAELGNPVHELLGSSYSAGEDAKKKGMISTLGKGRVAPTQWKDAGVVHPSLAGTMMVGSLRSALMTCTDQF
jgi:poly [ADP-ribose] polymerase